MTYDSAFLPATPRPLPGIALNPDSSLPCSLEVKTCKFAEITKAPPRLRNHLPINRAPGGGLLKPPQPPAPRLDLGKFNTVTDGAEYYSGQLFHMINEENAAWTGGVIYGRTQR